MECFYSNFSMLMSSFLPYRVFISYRWFYTCTNTYNEGFGKIVVDKFVIAENYLRQLEFLGLIRGKTRIVCQFHKSRKEKENVSSEVNKNYHAKDMSCSFSPHYPGAITTGNIPLNNSTYTTVLTFESILEWPRGFIKYWWLGFKTNIKTAFWGTWWLSC